MVYETSDPQINWTGDRHAEGVYYWVIRYTDIEGEENTISGHIALTR